MSFPQFTTPTVVLTFTEESLDLTQARNVYVTFRSSCAELTKTGADLQVEEKQISVFLRQEETGQLDNNALIQANWTTPGGLRAASDIVAVEIDPQLLRKVIE